MNECCGRNTAEKRRIKRPPSPRFTSTLSSLHLPMTSDPMSWAAAIAGLDEPTPPKIDMYPAGVSLRLLWCLP